MVFHWGPSELDQMALSELIAWRERARERWDLMNGAQPET